MDMLVSVHWKIGEDNVQFMFVTPACHLGSFYEFIDYIILEQNHSAYNWTFYAAYWFW